MRDEPVERATQEPADLAHRSNNEPTEYRLASVRPDAWHLSRSRFLIAFGIAAISDLISAVTGWAPPIQWCVDAVTALLLFIVLGWRWPLLPALVAEAIPGLAVFPFWLLVVAVIAGQTAGRRAP